MDGAVAGVLGGATTISRVVDLNTLFTEVSHVSGAVGSAGEGEINWVGAGADAVAIGSAAAGGAGKFAEAGNITTSGNGKAAGYTFPTYGAV